MKILLFAMTLACEALEPVVTCFPACAKPRADPANVVLLVRNGTCERGTACAESNNTFHQTKSGLLPACGSVMELEQMIQLTTGKSALLSYSWYGCFCGIGGRGTPVDSTDQCCLAHDCCYRKLREDKCSPLITFYQFDTDNGNIICSNEQSWCKREICLCDKAVASCFASTLHSYNKSYRFYFKLKCQGSKLQC